MTPIALAIDPSGVFKVGAEVLDPRDVKNESDIDKNVRAAISVRKK